MVVLTGRRRTPIVLPLGVENARVWGSWRGREAVIFPHGTKPLPISKKDPEDNGHLFHQYGEDTLGFELDLDFFGLVLIGQ